MHVLILCAGLGSRLDELTKSSPKCLVEINGTPILSRLLKQLEGIGIAKENITLCSGYHRDKLPEGLRQIENKLYKETNMVYSLKKGVEYHLNSKLSKLNLTVIYGDCLYDNKIIELVMKDKFNENIIKLPIDLSWKNQWSERYNDPYSDAETLIYDKKTLDLISIGNRNYPKEDYMAQFMGILTISRNTVNGFIKEINNLDSSLLKKISTTEFINNTIDRFNYKVIPGNFKWCEVDTKEDLDFAKKRFG